MNNPYRMATPGADANLSPQESAKQAAILSSDEIGALQESIIAGDQHLEFSYHPLPRVIKAP